MHPEVEELRPKLKELLYDCAVEIKATKAALFLYDGTSKFELATEYGFRGSIRQVADLNDPIADRCGRGRNPFFVNGVGTEPRFSQILWESTSDRLLVAPLYSRGKLVGFIDMRDKAAKQPFEQSDLPKATAIAERLVELFTNKNVFGHQFITLSQVEPPPGTPPAGEARPPAASPAPPPQQQPQSPAATPPHARRIAESQPLSVTPQEQRAHVPRLATIVLEARTAASRIAAPSAAESLSDAEVSAVRDVLRSVLLIPGAVAAAFTAFGHLGGVQEIAARSGLSEEAKSLVQSRLNVWLGKRGETAGFVKTNVTTPFGTKAGPVVPDDIRKVFTAPLSVSGLHGLYLTVAFAGNPDRVAHELLAVMHAHVQMTIEQTMQHGAMAALQSRIAEKLVEPDFTKYPDLRRHSQSVSTLAEAFARYLMLTAEEAECARIVGLVHDVGMRLLDYDRLYRKQDLTPEELGFLREHPAVGAAMVEPLLGREVALAVLAHHERWDGKGYPNEQQREEIPLMSRIVQLCDAWVSMTDESSYQQPVAPSAALSTITSVAGAQFDPELAGRFVEMMRGRRS